jgi:hypothetical protein
MYKALCPALLLVLCLLPACSLFGDNDLSDFREQRRQWERQNVINYTYQLNVACFCPYAGPISVEVRADTVYTATVIETGEAITNLDNFSVKTIDGLFEVLEQALKEADKVDVDYDAQYGFPSLISIDYYKDAVDDEIGYRATNLHLPRVD